MKRASRKVLLFSRTSTHSSAANGSKEQPADFTDQSGSNLMTHYLKLAAVALMLMLVPTLTAAQDIFFTDVPTGAVPPEFEPKQTGDGESGRWEVVKAEGASGGS